MRNLQFGRSDARAANMDPAFEDSSLDALFIFDVLM